MYTGNATPRTPKVRYALGTAVLSLALLSGCKEWRRHGAPVEAATTRESDQVEHREPGRDEVQRMLMNPGRYPIRSTDRRIVARCVDLHARTPDTRSAFEFGTSQLRVRRTFDELKEETSFDDAVRRGWIKATGTGDYSSVGVRSDSAGRYELVVDDIGLLGQSKASVAQAEALLKRPSVVAARKAFKEARTRLAKLGQRNPGYRDLVGSIDQRFAWSMLSKHVPVDLHRRVLRSTVSDWVAGEHFEAEHERNRVRHQRRYRAPDTGREPLRLAAGIVALRTGRRPTAEETAALEAALGQRMAPATDKLDTAIRLARRGEGWLLTTTSSRRSVGNKDLTIEFLAKQVANRAPFVCDERPDHDWLQKVQGSGVRCVHRLRAVANGLRGRPTVARPIFLGTLDEAEAAALYQHHEPKEVVAATRRAKELRIRVVRDVAALDFALRGLAHWERAIVLGDHERTHGDRRGVDYIDAYGLLVGKEKNDIVRLPLVPAVEFLAKAEKKPTHSHEFFGRLARAIDRVVGPDKTERRSIFLVFAPNNAGTNVGLIPFALAEPQPSASKEESR